MKVIIYSNIHEAWWGPDYRGYVYSQEKAGVFDYEEAHKKYPYIGLYTSCDDFFVVVEK